MMNRKNITVNGYPFAVESTAGDENCFRLCYGNVVVLDDTANEDYYGDIDDVADIMAAEIKEETEKAFPWFALLGAVVEQGSDPCAIESEEDAKAWAETINGGNVREITDADELENAKPMLDLEGCKVAHIYAFCDGHNSGHICLEKDY